MVEEADCVNGMGWIRSKPVYEDLSPLGDGLKQVLVSLGNEGARAIEQVLPNPGDYLHLHAGEGSPPTAMVLRSVPFLFTQLRRVLLESSAGTVLSIAGPEQEVWQCFRIGRECGMALARIRPMLAGSARRTVYCVHCKALTPDVTRSTLSCSGCGQRLLVRDHFSRHLAAFVGVRVDAEVPGEFPDSEQLYL